VKGAPLRAMPTSRANAAMAAAPGLSNALDGRISTLMLPASNALDAAGRGRRPWACEPGAPPGRTPHRNARGPVDPALSILGGAKMSTQ